MMNKWDLVIMYGEGVNNRNLVGTPMVKQSDAEGKLADKDVLIKRLITSLVRERSKVLQAGASRARVNEELSRIAMEQIEKEVKELMS